MIEEVHFKEGDKVIKSKGDYTFEGVVVSAFHKLSGKMRYVVENEAGILHVFSFKDLQLVTGEKVGI